jgi:hypothetical protein
MRAFLCVCVCVCVARARALSPTLLLAAPASPAPSRARAGIALEDAACGDTLLVLLQGTFTYNGGAPQTVSASVQRRRRRRQQRDGAASGGGGDGGGGGGGAAAAPNPVPACNAQAGAPPARAQAARAVAKLYPLSPRGEFAPPAPGDAGCATDGPFAAGRVYYADTRGRLVEGGFAGTAGDNMRVVEEASSYLTTLPSRLVSQGDTSAALEGFVGVATSSNDLLLRIS